VIDYTENLNGDLFLEFLTNIIILQCWMEE
jgi:hypothetical protein